MNELLHVYGLYSLEQWSERVGGRGDAWKNLGDTKQPASTIREREASPVHSFRELVRITSFLNVMNKNLTLLFRGQSDDFSLLPALERDHWDIPERSCRVDLRNDRAYYWRKLRDVEQAVRDVLMTERMPRWRPFVNQPAARWAVIQHYEIWPTPLLDFTSSLRVAASFALEGERKNAFLYVVGVKNVRSDLMTLDDIGAEANSTLAVRLNAVCPPNAQRPHLQEGILIGRHPFTEHHVGDTEGNDASAILVAKLALVNRDGTAFWDVDFPPYRKGSLLPGADPLLDELRQCARAMIDDAVTKRVRSGPAEA